ncbi:TIGR01620 family protein [Escherichia coli]
MTEPLKPRIDFDGPLDVDQNPEFRAQQTFDENQAQNFAPATLDEAPEEEGQVEAVMDAALRPKRSLWRKMVMGGLALFGASVVGQGVQWTMNAWQTQDWVALGGCAAGALIIGAGVGSVVTEWRRLWRLRQRAHERDEARDLLHSHGTGKGRAFCEKLAQQAGIDQSHPALQRWYASIHERDEARDLLHSHGTGKGRAFCEKLAQQAGIDQSHPALQRWYASIHETQNDREVVSLYAHLVQPVLDAQARREISRSAAESTLMIAVSPLALVDMAFIAWRNLRLINRIATLYGIELGYYSRLRLFKLVLLNIAFAGASELVREVGMDWMSQDLAARLSTRAAQGIGAGLLTARLGIKAMELCRPLPWLDDDKPRLGDFRRQLIGQVKETLQKGKTPSEK